MASLLYQRFVRFLLPMVVMVAFSGGVAGALPDTGLPGLKGKAAAVSKAPPVQESFFTLKYWTAPALVAVLSGVLIPLYFNWGKHRFEERKKARKYRALIRERLGRIEMPGLPGRITNVSVGLDDRTFVKLRFSETLERSAGVEEAAGLTRASSDEDMPDEVMQRAFDDGGRLLLVFGDPGAGKTTLLQYYALCALDKKQCGKLGFSRPPMVFYLPLREVLFTATLSANLSRDAKESEQLIDAELFDKWQEKPSLVLLDGLDEISDPETRAQACRWVEKRVSGVQQGCFVVTSRLTGYGYDEVRNLDITVHAEHKRADILDFSEKQQEAFVRGWFEAAFLGDERDKKIDEELWKKRQRERAKGKSDRIIDLLKEEKNLVLLQLAGIPMILQLMVLLWKENDYLPSGRIDLYNSALDYMLQLRDKVKNIEAPLVADKARRVLAPVAWWMQSELKRDDVKQEEMLRKMAPMLASLADWKSPPPSSAVFCEHLVNRAGVLVKTSENYRFRHKSFREYFAGIELLKQCQKKQGNIDKLIPFFGEGWWSEPIRFFIAQSDAELFDYLMDKITGSIEDDPLSTEQRRLLDYVIDEAPEKQVTSLCARLLAPVSTEVRQRLVLDCLYSIGQVAAMPSIREFREKGLAKNRDIAGRAEEVLIALDPANRKTEMAVPALAVTGLLPSFRNATEYQAEYILIKGGSFSYSVTGKTETVPDRYFAKYPVTNRQYRRFIDYLKGGRMKGFGNALPLQTFNGALRQFAADSAVKGFPDYLKGKQDFASLFRSRYDADRKFGREDHPVAGVTWYAAQAYCLWISVMESGGNERGLYRLPTEIEWEFAAAGSEGRAYPWSNEEPTRRHANFNQNEGATTPVGRYPDGATPEGLYDMAGNVWEWMGTRYDEVKSAVSLRGGSWNDRSENLRCRARDFSGPGSSSGSGSGFRVVCPSPVF